MGNLLGGSAPLRGRAGLDLRISPFDFRAARTALGARAAGARMLLFGSAFDDEVQRVAAERADVELVDPGRMYGG